MAAGEPAVYPVCKKEYEKAEQEALHILEHEKPWELVRLNIYETLLAIYTRRRAHKETLRYGKEFEDTFAYMESHPKLWRQQTYADLTEESIKLPSKLYQIRINCTESALTLGNMAQAVRFLELLPWEEETWMQRYYPVFDNWRNSYVELLADSWNIFRKVRLINSYRLQSVRAAIWKMKNAGSCLHNV